jgi:hypothetical protein
MEKERVKQCKYDFKFGKGSSVLLLEIIAPALAA